VRGDDDDGNVLNCVDCCLIQASDVKVVTADATRAVSGALEMFLAKAVRAPRLPPMQFCNILRRCRAQ